jgi:hypothetical protein
METGLEKRKAASAIRKGSVPQPLGLAKCPIRWNVGLAGSSCASDASSLSQLRFW